MKSEIPGVEIRAIRRFEDARGWLMETFRSDEMSQEAFPAMGYVSCTKPGVARGPHEHVDQTDGFAFLFGKYTLYLWENRPGLPRRAEVFEVGEANPVFIAVPPGVVHAYRNAGEDEALVLNFPNRLYAGPKRAEPVDEIRHEDDPESPFRL